MCTCALKKWVKDGSIQIWSDGFFPPLSCQEEGLEMSKNKKQSGDKEESILNGPNGFSEKL